MAFCTILLKYFAGRAMQIEQNNVCRDNYGMYKNQVVYERRQPVGVCGLITPWNYPALMLMFKVAPMIASGCTGVSKLPELTPLTGLRLCELWHEIDGVMPGVWNAVPGYGNVAGQALIEHPAVRKIAFTGSTATGKHILKTTADDIKRVTLELGGKGPLIVFADSDIDKAAAIAANYGFGNTG